MSKEPQKEMEPQLIEVMKMTMQMIQFVSIVNLIQMKVIANLKNRTNEESQHWMELQLIELKKMRNQMIQFVSNVNLIRKKLMKVIDNLKNIPNKEFQHWKKKSCQSLHRSSQTASSIDLQEMPNSISVSPVIEIVAMQLIRFSVRGSEYSRRIGLESLTVNSI
jgi:hypothetical protein